MKCVKRTLAPVMDEIVPQLWVGELESSLTASYLSHGRITRVISVMRAPPSPPDGIPPHPDAPPESAEPRTIDPKHVLVVPVDDMEDAPLLLYFGKCSRFIADALAEKWVPDDVEVEEEEGDLIMAGLTRRQGKPGLWKATRDDAVLVHCQAGYSRSVAIVAAYLMWSRGLSVDDALNLIRSRRPCASPNSGFIRQLELFGEEKCVVNLQSPRQRRFLLNDTTAIDGYVDPTVLIAPRPDSADPYSDPPSEAPQEKKRSSARLRCKMCRHELALEEHVVEHEPGKGELAFEPHKRDSVRRGLDSGGIARQKGPGAVPAMMVAAAAAATKPLLLCSSACSAYFVEPLEWMNESSNVVPGVVSGRLECPNTRCRSKLGNWSWAGSQCGCGAWVTPSFALQRSKVDALQ